MEKEKLQESYQGDLIPGLGSQDKQLGIAHGDIKDLIQAFSHVVGDHGPDHPAVGDDQYWLGQISFKGVEKRGASMKEVLKAFSS